MQGKNEHVASTYSGPINRGQKNGETGSKNMLKHISRNLKIKMHAIYLVIYRIEKFHIGNEVIITGGISFYWIEIICISTGQGIYQLTCSFTKSSP